jgi:hypothetical protein
MFFILKSFLMIVCFCIGINYLFNDNFNMFLIMMTCTLFYCDQAKKETLK